MNRNFIRLSGLLFLAIICISSCNNNGNVTALSLKRHTPNVLKNDGAEIFLCWELKNESHLWDTNFVQPPYIKLYQDSVSHILGKNSFNRIKQERAFQDLSYPSVHTQNGDSINMQLIHAKTLGRIRPINQLESQLLDYQISRFSLFSHPTEFHGFILFNASLNLVKVYFAASDQPWPPKPNSILDAVTNDQTLGWTLKYHLHNHYEPESHDYLGILAPSTTDVQYYLFLKEEFHLEQAIITNGFHTVEIPNVDFPKFKAPENN